MGSTCSPSFFALLMITIIITYLQLLSIDSCYHSTGGCHSNVRIGGFPLGATSNFLKFSPNFPYVQYKKSSHKTALPTNAIALFFTLLVLSLLLHFITILNLVSSYSIDRNSSIGSNLSTIISFPFILPITSINIYNLQLIYLTVPCNF